MKKLRITTIFLSVWMSSCTHYYYVPNVQNVPLFREKNEYRLSAALGAGDYSTCTEVQAAYSVTDNIGILTNFMSAKGGEVSENNWAKGNYFDGAIGYYKPVNRFGVFEIYGGLGVSNQHHQYIDIYNNFYNGTSDLSFTKLFVQPSFGLTFKWFDIALSNRFCSLYFNKIDNQINRQDPKFYYLNSIAQKKNYLFLEPAITIRGGWKYYKMQFQFATASYTNRAEIYFENYHFSLGLYFTLAERYRKEVQKKQ